MKKYKLKLNIILVFLFIFIFLGMFIKRDSCEEKFIDVEEIHKNLTLKEKISLMFVLSFFYNEENEKLFDQEYVRTISEYGLRNFCINGKLPFKKWVEKIKMLDVLIHPISHLRKTGFLFIDQENGVVRRFTDLENPCGNMAIGATGSFELAEKGGRLAALIAKSIGTNCLLAPNVDQYDNPMSVAIQLRSFGVIDKIYPLALAFSEGAKKEGVLTTFKHFPDFSDQEKHPDLMIVKIDKSKEELLKIYKGSKELLNSVDFLLISHIFYPKIDNRWPASASPVFIKEIIKKELGFKGLIAIEPVFIPGYLQLFKEKENPVIQSIKSGVDLIFIGNVPGSIRNILDDLSRNATSDAELRKRIEESSLKILKTYQKIASQKDKGKIPLKNLKSLINEFSEEVAQKSVVKLRDENRLIPLNLNKTVIYVPFSRSVQFSNYNLLKSYFKNLVLIAPEEAYLVKNQNLNYDYVILDLSGVGIIAGYATGLTEIEDKIQAVISNFDDQKIILITALPQLGSFLKPSFTTIITFDTSSSSFKQAMKILTGVAEAQGKLPVPVWKNYDKKEILYPAGYYLN